jgi:hypothetical protein
MGSPTLESKLRRIPFGIRHVKTAGLAGLVCGANIRPNLFEGGGSCEEAEIQIARFGNPRPRRSGWMSRGYIVKISNRTETMGEL